MEVEKIHVTHERLATSFWLTVVSRDPQEADNIYKNNGVVSIKSSGFPTYFEIEFEINAETVPYFHERIKDQGWGKVQDFRW